MIKEWVREIVDVEQEAENIVKNAREEASALVKKAQIQTQKMVAETQNSRKSTAAVIIKAAEKHADQESEKITEEYNTQAMAVRNEFGKNLESAVNLVFERIVKHGNK